MSGDDVDPDELYDRERADEGEGLRRVTRLPRLGEAMRPTPPEVEPDSFVRPPRRDLATDPLMQRMRTDAWRRFAGRGWR